MDCWPRPQEVDRASMERQLDDLGQVLVEKLKTFNVAVRAGRAHHGARWSPSSR